MVTGLCKLNLQLDLRSTHLISNLHRFEATGHSLEFEVLWKGELQFVSDRQLGRDTTGFHVGKNYVAPK